MSKGLFWKDPNCGDGVEIIEKTDEAARAYGTAYGSDTVFLSQEHIDAIKAGKALAWTDGEYVTFVAFKS